MQVEQFICRLNFKVCPTFLEGTPTLLREDLQFVPYMCFVGLFVFRCLFDDALITTRWLPVSCQASPWWTWCLGAICMENPRKEVFFCLMLHNYIVPISNSFGRSKSSIVYTSVWKLWKIMKNIQRVKDFCWSWFRGAFQSTAHFKVLPGSGGIRDAIRSLRRSLKLRCKAPSWIAKRRRRAIPKITLRWKSLWKSWYLSSKNDFFFPIGQWFLWCPGCNRACRNHHLCLQFP